MLGYLSTRADTACRILCTIEWGTKCQNNFKIFHLSHGMSNRNKSSFNEQALLNTRLTELDNISSFILKTWLNTEADFHGSIFSSSTVTRQPWNKARSVLMKCQRFVLIIFQHFVLTMFHSVDNTISSTDRLCWKQMTQA